MTPTEWSQLKKIAASAVEQNQGIEPEHVIGAGVGGASLLPLLTQGRTPDLSNVKHMSVPEAVESVRPGDVMLTRNKVPTSGWRMFTPHFASSPWYHAEVVAGMPGGETTHFAGSAGDVAGVMRDQEGALLMRPKNMKYDVETLEKLNDAATRLSAETYAGGKAPLTALIRTFMPHWRGAAKLPEVCKGNICSTGPAQVLREIGVDPMTRAPKGMELTGDYLRNPNFQAVGTVGKRINPRQFMLKSHLPVRALMAGGLGYGAYRAAKDVREGDTHAPLAGVAGAGAGMMLGRKVEELSDTPRASGLLMRDKLRQMLGKGSPTAQNIGSNAHRLFRSVNNKYPLIPSALGMVAGGLGAYGATKGLTHAYRRRQQAKHNTA